MLDSTSPQRPKRQRASRKGQPRTFICPREGCEKRYTRAEHLARHELNHNPKQIYRCEEEGCSASFVRPDLYARHQNKHREKDDVDQDTTVNSVTQEADFAQGVQDELQSTLYSARSDLRLPNPALLQDNGLQAQPSSRTLLTPGSSVTGPNPLQIEALLQNTSGDKSTVRQLSDLWTGAANVGDGFLPEDQGNENFASWLFDSPGSHDPGFDFNNMPFLDFGMNYTAHDVWAKDDYGQNGPSPLGGRTYSTTSAMSTQRLIEPSNPHIYISEERRIELILLLESFANVKSPDSKQIEAESILYGIGSGHMPNLTVEWIEKCISSYWRDIAIQLPIVHQATFSATVCEPLLLVAVIALGVASMVRAKPKGMLQDHRIFADFVATHLRWQLFTHSHAQPPVHLWVAQTLVLLEFYEKLYSTRQLHERAHIHHASTLTLLRRGSPMVGRTGSETPPSEVPTRAQSPTLNEGQSQPKIRPETHSWWKRWVSNESMNRVVFAAFQLDVLHATMFGHSADLLPQELRLPLPCDESLWAAKNAEDVRHLENTFAMYRIKPVNFLDGLKRSLHGYEVQTHHLGRLILMAGLLSVGWHLNRREKHVQFLETVPSVQQQARWRKLLLQAFEHWRRSFDEVLENSTQTRPDYARRALYNGSEPTVLFHLAHLSMHVDIIDCQILSGSRRLLGRKVSAKDRSSVFQRMKIWASSAMARHAALHAFKLLHTALCHYDAPNALVSNFAAVNTASHPYQCRNDPFIYRPWILYLAGLTIWAYQYASTVGPATMLRSDLSLYSQTALDSARHYLSICANVETADRLPDLISGECCAAVLQVLSKDFQNAESEIILEASKRLQECIDMLSSTTQMAR